MSIVSSPVAGLLARLDRALTNAYGWLLALFGVTGQPSLLPVLDTLRTGEVWHGLTYLINGWEADEGVTRYGRRLLVATYHDLIATRRAVESRIAAEGAALRAKRIEAPLFIVGLPRTGSTFLQGLLDVDPGNRCFRLYELMSPARPDRAAAQGALDTWFGLEPELAGMHAMRVEGPDECCHLFEHSFVDRHSLIMTDMPGYANFLYSRTPKQMAPVYERYRAELAMMMGEGDKDRRLVLKDNTHMLFLPALVAAFPDARIIHTTRHIDAVVSSSLSGLKMIARFYYSGADLAKGRAAAMAKRDEDYLGRCAERMIAFAQTAAPDRMVTVRYDDLVSNPVAEIERIYAHWRIPVTDAFRAALDIKLAERNKRPRHKYPAVHASDPRLVDYERVFGWGRTTG